ncbi:MAG TPA: type II toxin-antitoxin system Phd/YefM family antitoxin [Ramlibacter sp.]|jgi:prevent-host-death family protein|nr:type II toxin-antitoxin system Phd/YefM family antitoxin [Ramlibacter sp.]
MAHVWQVQEAKSRLAELMDLALSEGPQVITRHGRPVVKVVAVDAGDVAVPDDGFLEFLLSIPKSGLEEGLPKMPRRNRRKPMFGEE